MINQLNEKKLINQWILKELALLQKDYFSHLEKKEINLIALKLIRFTKEKLSNEYLELIKLFPWETKTKKTLLFVYQQLLLLLHPFTPFLTEYIYQEITGEKVLNSQIEIVKFNHSEEAVWQIDLLLLLLNSIRQVQVESNPKEYYLELTPEWEKKNIPPFNFNQFLEPLTKSKVLFFTNHPKRVFNSWIDLKPFGVLRYQKTTNLEAKKKDLEKQQKIYQKEYEKSKNRLENQDFLRKAPPTVVAKEKEKLIYYQTKKQKISQELEKL
ncbi:MAG: class I tRNA ligase family protein [Candidatus Moeniiplasma glomeromycotorum]|nr:class I tRNA ligase family protein [Candidatus Moeniiplasma glomeromycotorum]MCE8167071.1 class I tRNA ligase family protein [Candidatus Moeniiplasma glomeromycotorum]MCE8168917.1 class I tRNA ligase family protein [Candidatus Moeniiplasma glomeromycotorum]